MVIHALQNGDDPENLGRYRAPCAACGATQGLTIIAILAGLLLMVLENRWLTILGALVWVSLLPMLEDARIRWKAGRCEHAGRWNLIARASMAFQQRFLLLPPAPEDLQLAAIRGRELLEKMRALGITTPTLHSDR